MRSQTSLVSHRTAHCFEGRNGNDALPISVCGDGRHSSSLRRLQHSHTIIPAHRRNSCVSADCTLSLAHDQETTWKKGNPDLAGVWRNLGRNRPITSQRSRLMTLHTVMEASKIYLVLSPPPPPKKMTRHRFILCNSKVRYRVNNSTPLNPIASQNNAVHALLYGYRYILISSPSIPTSSI
jgi:hypothetical protein